jgi:acyl carrier protein
MQAITRDELAVKIIGIIESVRPRLKGSIKPDTVLTPGLGFDSLAFIETIIAIEEQFDISMGEIEEFDASQRITADELANFVMTKLGTVSHV